MLVEVRKPLFLLHFHTHLHLLAHGVAYDVADRGLHLSGESVGTERRPPGRWLVQIAVRRWNSLSIGHSKT